MPIKFEINFYGILILFLISLVAAFIDTWVGVTAFLCSTVVLVICILEGKETTR